MRKRKAIKRFIIICILAASCNNLPEFRICRAHSAGDVLINEVAWMGSASSTYNEWIELYNATDYDIDLDGWTLYASDGSPQIDLSGPIPAYSYFLLERTNDDVVLGIQADLIYGGSLGNSAEILELRDDENNPVDILDASDGWPAGDNEAKRTLERDEEGGYYASLIMGGTPRSKNSFAQAEEDGNAACGNGQLDQGEGCDDGNQDDKDGCSSNCEIETAGGIRDGDQDLDDNINPHDVAINEFVSDPISGENEWIELCNSTERAVDLEGWVIIEGGGSTTTISGILGIDDKERFFVIEDIKGNLNNGGDLITLKDETGKIIDKVAYGSWDDGNINGNADAAEDPMSVSRVKDGSSSGNDHDDFSITLTPTKGAANIITLPEDENEENPAIVNQGNQAVNNAAVSYSNDIIIAEIYPNPPGDEIQGEFIELYNKGIVPVDLAGWILGDDSNKKHTISAKSVSAGSAVIKPGEYLAFYRSASGIALNNTSDRVKLCLPGATQPLITIKYDKTEEGLSYNLKNIDKVKNQANSETENENNWVWSKTITPGEPNIIDAINHPPAAKFSVPAEIKLGVPAIFDSASSTDPDGNELSYFWDFGDGFTNILASPEHTYFKAGDFKAVLTVSDGIEEVKVEKKIKVITDNIYVFQELVSGKNKKIFINEVVPAPAGDDKFGEWVELRSEEESDIVLDGWKLDDEEGGSTPFILGPEYKLKAGGFLVITRVESGISLNNSKDDIRLFDPFGKLVNIVSYASIKEGKSYSRCADGAWAWTEELTPGKANVVKPASLNSESQKINKSAASKNSAKKSSKQHIEITLEKINELEIGTNVVVRGTVAVLPGALGTQYFYMVGSFGIQVYNFKKEFPKFKIGDLIEVSGEITEASGERRIKTSSIGDMKIVGYNAVPEPMPATCEALKDDKRVRLVEVEGEITKKQGSTLYVDDGTEEIVVYIKKNTGISTKELKTGDNIKVSGILGFSKDERRLFPRFMEDIIKVAKAEEGGTGEVLGDNEMNQDMMIPGRDKKMEMIYYFMVMGGGVVGVLVWWWRKKYS